jgi:hypothetical protein
VTHTHYREGLLESLKNDFVFVITGAKGYNKKGCAPRLRDMAKITTQVIPVNMGCMEYGNLGRGIPAKQIIENIKDSDLIQVVYDDKEEAIKALRKLKEADLGISVVISGLHDEVKDIVQKAGVGEEPHTANITIGFMGNKEKVAPDDIRLITTMCGHHMISARIVEHLIKMIQEGRITPLDAAVTVSGQCTCGAFNTVRASKLFKEISERGNI